MLHANEQLLVVGEAVDGLEAVQKAAELQPDVVLIDIGLPKLNGIAVAQQIRPILPQAKLLFVSLESSPAIVQEVMRQGAHGYVHKLRAHGDLLPAIEAVLEGKPFVSEGIEYAESRKSDYRHEVHFYPDDENFLQAATRFLSSALHSGGAAIAVVTRAHEKMLVERLKADGRGVDAAARAGNYLFADAAAFVSEILLGKVAESNRPDSLSDLVEIARSALTREGGRIAVFGECAGLLCAHGNTSGALEMEKWGNAWVRKQCVDLICAYPLNTFPKGQDDPAFDSVCAEHTAIFSR
jgi:CheY-like chemotaxis protein